MGSARTALNVAASISCKESTSTGGSRPGPRGGEARRDARKSRKAEAGDLLAKG